MGAGAQPPLHDQLPSIELPICLAVGEEDEKFRAAFEEYRQQFDPPFNIEVIATAFKGYPSLEAYRQHWHLMRSFEEMIAEDLNNDTLQAHGTKVAAMTPSRPGRSWTI